jgi:hypothetical protein
VPTLCSTTWTSGPPPDWLCSTVCDTSWEPVSVAVAEVAPPEPDCVLVAAALAV